MDRTPILWSITGCWIFFGYFIRSAFIIDLLFLITFLKINVNSSNKCLFKLYTRSITLGVGPVQIWQQGYHNKVCHVVLRFYLTLGKSLYYFLVLIVDFEYSLFVVNVNKCYLMVCLCRTPNRRYVFGSCCKTLQKIWKNTSFQLFNVINEIKKSYFLHIVLFHCWL